MSLLTVAQGMVESPSSAVSLYIDPESTPLYSQLPTTDMPPGWMRRKDLYEFGYSPEVHALTEALMAEAETLVDKDAVPAEVRRLLQETAWRVAVKFYARDGIENLVLQVYNRKQGEVAQSINRVEFALLEHLGWRLPFEAAEKLLPAVFQKQIACIDKLVTGAATAGSQERRRFQQGETTRAAAIQAFVYHQWLMHLRELRKTELDAIRGGEARPGALEVLFDRGSDMAKFEEAAERMLKKRPMRPRGPSAE